MVEVKYVSGRDGTTRGSYTLLTDAGADIKTAYEGEADTNVFTDAAVAQLAAGGAATKEFYSAVVHGTNGAWYASGNFAGYNLNSANDVAYMTFHVPADFTAITEAVVIVLGHVSVDPANIDITSDYGTNLEAPTTHSESDTASTYDVNANELLEIDISGILTALSADDYVGIKVKYGDANITVFGIRFKYS